MPLSDRLSHSTHSTLKLSLTRPELRESLPMVETSAVVVGPGETCGNAQFARDGKARIVADSARGMRGEVLREAAGQLLEAGVDAFLQRLYHRLDALFRYRLVAVVAIGPHDVSRFHIE